MTQHEFDDEDKLVKQPWDSERTLRIKTAIDAMLVVLLESELEDHRQEEGRQEVANKDRGTEDWDPFGAD